MALYLAGLTDTTAMRKALRVAQELDAVWCQAQIDHAQSPGVPDGE
jgi:hypothetical protein